VLDARGPDARALALLARIRLRLGRVEQARESALAAVALAPDLVRALLELALGERARGAREACAELLVRIRARQPQWLAPRCDLAAVLGELGRVDEARAEFDAVLGVDPDFVPAWRGLAALELALGQDWEAYSRAQGRVMALAPDDAPACDDYGVACRQAGEFTLAHAAFERALARQPGLLAARWALFQAPRHAVHADADEVAAFAAQWRAGLEHFEALDYERPEVAAQVHDALRRATPFHRDYIGLDTPELTRRYGALVERMAERLFRRAPAVGPPPRRTRVRVAFVSAHLREHTVTRLFGSLVRGLDPARFERCLVQLEANADSTTQALRAHAEHTLESALDARRAHTQLVALAPDVIVYLDLGMHPIAQILAARRLAPVQCVLWGHPVSTGFSTIDHFLSSAAMELPDAPSRYHERLHLLPGLGTCFSAPTEAPDPAFRMPYPERADRVHYLVAQNVAKQLPHHDAVWARIAAAVPGACFSFVGIRHRETRALLEQRLRLAFDRAGTGYDGRVHLFPYLRHAQFLALAANTDLNLDTIGWSGGNTTLEITAMDTPTLTLPGVAMRSRHSMAMLEAMGLPGLVAVDEDDYCRIAIELGRDPDRRTDLRAAIAARKAVLYDDRAVVEDFARFLETAHAQSAEVGAASR